MTMVPSLTVLLIGMATGLATLVGGSMVLRYRSALDLMLGFSSGTIVGVALFDLLPEALDLAGDSQTNLSITTAVAAGFALYLAADRATLIMAKGAAVHRHFVPASFTLHSCLDGLGIGFAFHVSSAAAVVVAIGVLAHDFVDGANTVAACLERGSSGSVARSWLAADAVAPIAGIFLGTAMTVSASSLSLLLAAFAGFFLYIGASELLPRSHARRPQMSTMVATTAGLAFIYAVIRLASR